MYLLILDDDERVSRFLATIAIERGWTVEANASETEFQASFRRARPDAIMLDLQLGKSDGIEQLHFLRRENFPGPIVLMSGFDPRVLAVAQQVGAALGLAIASGMEKPARAARVREVLSEIERTAQPAPASTRPAAKATVQTRRIEQIISPISIAQAINAGRMELYLQPIVAAADRAATRAEGLIRWHHPVAGLVFPEDFISIAEGEETVIELLTTWVLDAAAVQYRRLAALGFTIQISVNVSGANLRSLDFPDRVAALLNRASMPPEALALEVTESVAVHDSPATADILTRLRLKGLALAIDDFGTGHASLEALRRLPFSTIKIDRRFVEDLRHSRDSLSIVQSIIELARNMGLTTVAEGVDDEETASALIELGAGGLQGYLFSRPLSFDDFVKWLQSWPNRST